MQEKILNLFRKLFGKDLNYVAKGTFWWIFGRIFVFLISFVLMIVLGRFLAKETYGTYRYLISMASLLSIFTLPGIGQALIREVAQGREGAIFPCLKIKIKWGLLATLFSFFIFLWYILHQNFILSFSFLIAGIFLPFVFAFQIFLSFWNGKKRFDLQSKYLVLSELGATLFLILVIFLTKNFLLIILGFFLPKTFFRYLFLRLTLKKVKKKLKKEEIKKTISFGKNLTLIQAFEIFSNQIDKIFIWQFLGPTFLAIYSFAQLPLLKIQGAIPVLPLALPKLAERKIKKIKKNLFQKFKNLFLLSFPFSLFLIILAPFVYKIFFPLYLESIPYFQVLCLTLIFVPFSLLATCLIAEMKTKELYILRTSSLFLKVVLLFFLIPFYKIWGAVLALLIVQIFSSILLFHFFKKI